MLSFGIKSRRVAHHVLRTCSPIQAVQMKYLPETFHKLTNSKVMQPMVLLLIFQGVDLLLNKLENGKENGVDNTRSPHGNAQPAVQFLVEELDLRGLLDLLTLAYC